MMNYIFYKNKQKGYTLVFAVIISAIVLSIGVSILTISRKEFRISTAARESAVAFYTANSGLDCAIHHDNYGRFNSGFAPNVGCAGVNTSQIVIGNSRVVEFRMPDTYIDEIVNDTATPQDEKPAELYPCVTIVVTKDTIDVPIQGTRRTTIDSYGYNKGWNPDTMTCRDSGYNGTDRVERALQYVYLLPPL